MEPAEKKRKLILGGALILTLIAVVMVEDDEEKPTIDTIEAIQPTRPSTEKNRVDINTIDALEVDLLGQRIFNAEAGELFKSTSWAPERPKISLQQQQAEMEKQRAKAKAPEPTPPPLPFTYIGKIIDGNKIQVFLADSEQNYVVKLGDRIEDQYRIDAMNDETITLTYLPLDAKQTLAINENVARMTR